MRVLRISPVLAVAVAAALVTAASGSERSAARNPVSLAAAGTITISGVDSHDGMMYQDGAVYYWVGTKYGCGFRWNTTSPWCGYGVWTSTDKATWTYVRDLFDPRSTSGTFKNESWQWICGDHGDGCFNPRMTRRPDGVWILSFNGFGDYRHWQANGYYFMGCNGPAGPCGSGAGPPYGSTIKPRMYICRGAGDFSVFADQAGNAYIACTYSPSGINAITIEKLDPCWCNGVNVGITDVAAITWVESPGVFYDAANSTYVLTYSDPNCGYCSGAGTSYAVAPAPLGPWRYPSVVNHLGNPPTTERRKISAHSCGGQPRTVSILDGVPYEQIDLWYDNDNETNAGTHLEPLLPTGRYLAPNDGTLWAGGFQGFRCS